MTQTFSWHSSVIGLWAKNEHQKQ